ncbi:hypothetical protein Slin_6072 [Spirosoma linguale DSM 74]|uniref:Uncharacterized protein n=1 Tax=Spirosoma linguale (strain ATCC 33905 / DSM 74 / LMG 10896 / Claus 1) TaxID=504472 RepID=D2QTA2_SPILD|nr:hypothetical protein Slin_6072 [Spirosoma linguale DSM 74]
MGYMVSGWVKIHNTPNGIGVRWQRFVLIKQLSESFYIHDGGSGSLDKLFGKYSLSEKRLKYLMNTPIN